MTRGPVVVAILCCASAAAVQGQQPRSQPVSASAFRFEPRITVPVAPETPLYAAQPQSTQRLHVSDHSGRILRAAGTKGAQAETDVICGLTVMRHAPDVDRGIVVQKELGRGSAVRRVNPRVCTSATAQR